MADTRDLKSLAHKAYGFESRWRHQKKGNICQRQILPFFNEICPYRQTKWLCREILAPQM